MTALPRLRRIARLGRVLGRHLAAAALADLLAPWPRLAARLPRPAGKREERLRRLLEDLGGTFIKLGQMLALQPDVLSLAACDALLPLLDRVAPFDLREVERIFVEELGRRPAELFDAFAPRPLATASIGQVHVARVGERLLAVKVQRPSAGAEFGGDVRLMATALALIRGLRLARLYWLVEPLSEFIAWTFDELDYRQEARAMERLRRNARGNPWEVVPAVDPACLARRILVTELLRGVTVLDYLRALEAGDRRMPAELAARGFEPHGFARHLIDNFLGDAFRHGLFHADLHPANLMILPGNRVGYLDFGITGALSRYSRRHLVLLTLSYTRGDLAGMSVAFFAISTLKPGADPDAFCRGLERLSTTWYAAVDGRTRVQKSFTLVMLEMLGLSRRTGILPERDVVKYIRSAIAIDGLVHRFAPGFEVGLYLAAACDRFLAQQEWRALLSFERLLGALAAAVGLAEGTAPWIRQPDRPAARRPR
ncbi:MAG TPA: AarF/UbiB family protein [Thermoanaerobaculia bacterium]|jgi:ubiquinone biosynthesis protein